ncbi:UDP-glucose--hexose-1-phosphate uridylyltransferase [Psychroflexus salis]|nr:UDP-glucose--hexose-1-phosphate uridylyltransferase [Psychroflexus salis]
MNTDLQDFSHKRYNILTGEWVLVSPHRTKRPWQGKQEDVANEARPAHDPDCYLCAGNKRINGEQNPNYKDVFIFTNDFAALQVNTKQFSLNEGLLKAESESGICKVICFSPDHSKSLPDMDVKDIVKVVEAWQNEYQTLGAKKEINHVQIFENKGAIMGCSNPHPHGQIWSQSSIPNEVLKKHKSQKKHWDAHKSSLLGNYLVQELQLNERIIYQNEHFVVLTPFWAVWPFEVMIAPKQHQKNILEMNMEEVTAYAEAISVLTNAYDRLFNCSFPYSAGIHQAPTNGEANKHWHWHMSFYPPLLRSATIKKFMVGYEMFGTPQRDITAEQAVDRLKSLIK